MKNIIKTFGLLAIFVTVSGAFAATSRVSVTSKASPRLPSIAGHIINATTRPNTTTTTTTTTSTSSSTTAYLTNSECIENYTDCVKEDDVCGSDFEECTTRVLFHGQMAKCLSVLYQCSSTGVTALFGTSAINNLSSGEIRNTNGDITDYTYPTNGSVLGQLIIGAGISNKFNTEQCVKSYTRCLNRDEICGADFELCTTDKEFKKQALLCDSTLQRCQSEGKIQLFGSVSSASSLNPSSGSRLRTMIENGQSLAAMNAVKTCQKITDNCLISACTRNPLRCVEGISLARISSADIIESGSVVTNDPVINSDPTNPEWSTEVTTATQVQKLLKSQCLETIGGNQYCHMTYREKTPTKKELVDIDLMEDVFALAYSARKSAVNIKVQEAVKKFDTRAKDACYQTIKSCAMRSCGGGLGSVCYKQSKTTTSPMRSSTVSAITYGDVHINSNPYNDILSGCSAIVNADANCIYSATSSGTDGYSYMYFDEDNNTFTTLFPRYTGSERDAIGAVGKLNSLLATSYNDAAIEDMKKQCQTIAKSCVRSMCGTDYINCYRHRTDIVSAGSYDTGSGKFDRSMNKMGGILDYNIVMGLCMDTVKSSPVCEEHLKVASAQWRDPSYKDFESWGGSNSVREAWLGANTTKVKDISGDNDVLIACRASDDQIKEKSCYDTMDPVNNKCIGVVDEDGCVYDQPVYMSESEYVLENGAKTLFQQLLMDEERNVQAIYNSKLTKEHNVCYANNTGGIMGTTNLGSTFEWVKLKGSKIPKNYPMNGLKTNQFSTSNDLYGSFCRVRVTVVSDDKYIQDQLNADATAYFAVGDPFTCGSWIKQSTLQKISDGVANRKLCEQGYGKWDTVTGECDTSKLSAKEKRTWALGTILPTVLAGVGGYAATDALQRRGTSLGGLLSGEDSIQDKQAAGKRCNAKINNARSNYYLAISSQSAGANDRYIQYFQSAVSDANSAKSIARGAGADVSDLQFSIPGAYVATTNTTYAWKAGLAQTLTQVKALRAPEQNDKDIKTKNSVISSANDALTILQNAPSGLNDPNESGLKTYLQTIRQYCQNDLNMSNSDVQSWCSSANVPSDFEQNLITTVNSGSAGLQNDSDASQTFVKNLQELENICSDIENGKAEISTVKNVVGATLSAAAAGGISWAVTKNALESAKENIKNTASQQWLNEVGEHIQCYVGADEVGTYGDVISIEVD